MVWGVLLGVGAAAFQSAAYLFSRLFISRFPKSAIYLLTLSHLIMGLFSVVLLAFLWPGVMPPVRDYAGAVFGTAFFYIAGHACLFLALERSAASRATPLLGLKVFILALLSVLFFHHSLTGLQWLSVLISVFAAVTLNWAGKQIPWQSIVWVLLACLGYSLSDLNIKILVTQFQYMGFMRSSIFSVSLCYLFCALVAMGVWRRLPSIRREMWKQAVPYSLAWFAGMMCIYACFSSIGVIFGNIVQSTRGIISIALGYAVALAGYERLEERIGKAVFFRRIAASLLMVAAIALFYLSG